MMTSMKIGSQTSHNASGRHASRVSVAKSQPDFHSSNGSGALILTLVLGVVACSPKPILYPNAHLQEVGKDTAKQDIADCRAVAKDAGSSGGSGRAGAVAGHTAVGAGTGAASGAAGGAIVGSAGIGAAIGAVSGAVYGLLGGLFSGSQPDQAHVNIVNRCLSERGYEVAGWK